MAALVAIEPALFRPDEQAWFVFDDGRKCLRKLDRGEELARSDFPAPAIRKDTIDPCRGMDGKITDSLSALRRTYRADGNPQGETYHELGNDSLTPVTHQFDRRKRRDDIKAAIEDVKNGRVAPAPVVLED